MKIIHIIPGSGGSFYCGNCLRDSKYYDALRKLGHDAVKIPMYLPLFSDEHDLDHIPVFYGAVSIYLKQLFPFFRNAPDWFDRMLNSKPMLKFAANRAGSTRAKGLEEMTISMLMGEHGQQREELERMTHWLAGHYKPDVIHLSNALLLGLDHKLKEELRVPVICSLQDEDVWVDIMTEPNREKVWGLMAEKSRYVDVFVSVSDYYTKVSIDSMKLDENKVKTLPIGIDPSDYTFINASEKPRSIGFISRMCYENGPDILVDAFILLKKKKAFSDVRLVLTGGYTGDDLGFLKDIKKKIRQNNLETDVEFHERFEGNGRKEFFSKVSVISVPVRKGEAFGIYIAEAMASGIPVVQPALGAFPEIVKASNGGTVYPENSPESLAGALETVLNDKDMLSNFSISGRKSTEVKFNINILAREIVDIYSSVCQPG